MRPETVDPAMLAFLMELRGMENEVQERCCDNRLRIP
jgi:hypothetical protein